MEQNEFEEDIRYLTKQFEESLEEKDIELIKGFEEYLYSQINVIKNNKSKFVLKDENAIKMVLNRVTQNMINYDINEKKRCLLNDEKFNEIAKISGVLYEMAREKLQGEDVNVSGQLEQKKDEMIELLESVEEYNKKEAKWLVSEGILDFEFLVNPDTKIFSLRLGHIKRELDETYTQNKNKEER